MTDNLIMRMRAQIYRSAWFPVVFLIFIAEFFFIPESKWQSNLYRVGLLLPFLLVFPWQELKPRLTGSPALLVSCLLILSLLLSLFWSSAAASDMTGKTLYHGLYIAGFVLIGTDILLRNPGCSDRFFYWLGWVIVITGLLSIWWHYQDHSFPRTRIRSIGQLRHPGLAAATYGFIGLYHFLDTPHVPGNSIWRRWLPGVPAAIMGLVVISLAQSRGVFIALLVVLLLGGILSRQKRFLVSLAVITLAALIMSFWWSHELLIMIRRGGWDSYRLEIWRPAIDLIRQAPILGHGILENFRFPISSGVAQPHAHNILLSTLLYGGILSGVLLLLLMGLVLRQGWRQWSADHDIKPLLLTVFSLTYLMTDGYRLVSNPVPNWVYFWLPVIWASSRELRNNTPRARY